MYPRKTCPYDKPSCGTSDQEQEEEENEYRVASVTGQSGGRGTDPTISTMNNDRLFERANRFARQMEQWKEGGEAKKHTQFMLVVGKRIQGLRQGRKLTRDDLAYHTTLDPEQLFWLEHGLLTEEEVKPIVDEVASYFEIDKEIILACNTMSDTKADLLNA